MQQNNICLASIVHNPDGKLTKVLDILPDIYKLYDSIVIEATISTDQELIDGLNDYAHIRLSPREDHLGRVRYNALNRALGTSCDVVHYIDFDRLLYWHLNFPQELRLSIHNLHPEKLTIFGRTGPAFDSHPWLQQKTEDIANYIISWRFGYNVDILSGSRGIPVEIGREIIEKSVFIDQGCANDAEWPLIVGPDRIRYVEVNGLGYESWLLGIEKSENDEIFARLRNLNDIVEVLYADNYNDIG